MFTVIINNFRLRPRLSIRQAWTPSTEQTSNSFVFHKTASGFPSCEWSLFALQPGYHPFFSQGIFFIWTFAWSFFWPVPRFLGIGNLPLSFYPVCDLGELLQSAQWGSGVAKEILISFLNSCTAFKGPLIFWEKTNNQGIIGDHLKGWLSQVNLVFIVQ